MRILYAIQGTGNGHITRSLSIIKELQKKASIEVLLSGIHNEIKIPIHVDYNFRGLGFVFGQNGGINYTQTFKQNKLRTLFSEIKSLPMKRYDLVISDFEPVSIWAAERAGIPSIGISNQASMLNPNIAKPPNPLSFTRLFMENYALSDFHIGLHYESTDAMIETPIIRDEIRAGNNTNEGFGLVYLPFYSDEIIYQALKNINDCNWIVFSKHSIHAYQKGNVQFEPIDAKLFTEKLLACNLVISAAGFGTTSEALHLGKRMVIIPMKNQYEQKFNAYTLKRFGVSELKTILAPDAAQIITKALYSQNPVKMDYPNNLKSISEKVMNLYYGPISNHHYQRTGQHSNQLDSSFYPSI